MIYIIRAGFIGFLTGLLSSLPLGPAGLEAVNRSISKGFWNGFKVSVGALFADYTYLIIINLGVFNILQDNKVYEGIFWIISGIILFLFAIRSKSKNDSSKVLDNPKLGGFITGFLITFINPSTFFFWIALSSTVMNIWKSNGHLFFYVSFLFMPLGGITWFTILNILASRGLKVFKNNVDKVASKFLTYILCIVSIFFVCYGLYTLIK